MDRATRQDLNQPPALTGVNLFAVNRALQEAVAREGAAWATDELMQRGRELGSAEWFERGELANRNPPQLQLFDRQGFRRDAFEFHPAWHECLAYLKRYGVCTRPWADPRPGAHVARAALFQLFAEVECGSLCPATMTFGAVPLVARDPGLAREWLPLLVSAEYDARFLPPPAKRGVMMGMGMTEKQGGSDVRANTTQAEPVGGGWYRLTGHKWFLSAPMSDAFMVTAQGPAGLSCFFLPRWRPDGQVNEIRLLRAKDKLGDRSNASAEVEFEGALARLVGEEGRGVPTILEMATYTRLDCANGSTGLMRQALSQALHHARHRRAFGRRLWDQPLMANVLADMALEVEAAVALTLRLARTFDGAANDEGEAALRRLLTPAAKYGICKRGPLVGAEAMEVLGGNGYVEDWPMARIYRQMPVNSIWEGSGNVMALDMLRARARHPETVAALATELAPARHIVAVFDRFADRLLADLADPVDAEPRARRLAEAIALAVQAGLLLRFAPPAVAGAFCASRLDGERGGALGTLSSDTPFHDILERVLPQ